jgi:hypothetical protein
MLTQRQQTFVKFAERRAANQEQFAVFVTDATAGRDPTDKELRRLVDQGLALARRTAVWLEHE